MRIPFAGFLLLHGIAHLVGFLSPWGLLLAPGRRRAPPPANELFAGRITLGDGAARELGLLWLLAAIAFAIVAKGVWLRVPWTVPSLVAVTLVSLVLTLVWSRAARVGAFVDFAVLAGVALWAMPRTQPG
ncbi:MAG: hypothetical protein ABI969_06090 [bacterium]